MSKGFDGKGAGVQHTGKKFLFPEERKKAISEKKGLHLLYFSIIILYIIILFN